MEAITHQKISISLSNELIKYAEDYQRRHKFNSRSEVVATAMRLLRKQELIEGYKAMREEYERTPDPLVELGTADELLPSEEDSW